MGTQAQTAAPARDPATAPVGGHTTLGSSSATDEGAVAAHETQPLAHTFHGDEQAMNRIIATGAGLLADAYDLFAIDIVVLVLEVHYGTSIVGVHEKSLLVSSMLAGTITGQVTFGYVCDWMGRRASSLVTASLTIVGALLCAGVGVGAESSILIRHLVVCRFLLGIGVGGEYPVTAAASAEISEDPDKRGRYMCTCISCQAWGILLSCVVAIVTLRMGMGLEACWRLMLGFGAVPSTLALFLRWKLDETRSFASQCPELAEGRHQAPALREIAPYRPLLIGTTSTWFLMNFSLYSMGSFKSSIMRAALDLDSLSARQQVVTVAYYSGVTSLFAVSGFMSAFYLINRVGRYHIQMCGFLALAATFFVLSALNSYIPATTFAFVWLIGQVFFFQNCGPNTTTYIIAAEAFPTRIRGTCHGISAACGKFGAVVGTFALPPADKAFGIWAVFGACGMAAIVGSIMTWGYTPRTPPNYTSGAATISYQAAQVKGKG